MAWALCGVVGVLLILAGGIALAYEDGWRGGWEDWPFLDTGMLIIYSGLFVWFGIPLVHEARARHRRRARNAEAREKARRTAAANSRRRRGGGAGSNVPLRRPAHAARGRHQNDGLHDL